MLCAALAACAKMAVERPVPAGAPAVSASPEWLPLFDGRALDDWTPKFAGAPAGVNLNDTFRVDSGLLKVRYDRWSAFNGEFGHLFFAQRPFSHYVLVVEYRFVDAPAVTNGPPWARRNSGIVVHAQPPEVMTMDQDFPVGLEIQLLGGLVEGQSRPTASLCTTGTQDDVGKRRVTQLCLASTAPTHMGNGWVRLEATVLGDSLVRHIVNGDTVLTYTGGRAAADSATLLSGGALANGYIAIQAKSAPVDFRRIELLNLSGCTDPRSLTYKPYFVHPDSSACFYASPPVTGRP